MQADEGEVICCEFYQLVRRDPPTLLDLVKDPLAQIAGAMKVLAKANRLYPFLPRRDVCSRAVLAGKCSDRIGVRPRSESNVGPYFGSTAGRRQDGCRAPCQWSAPDAQANNRGRHMANT
jgi:hypothetical protein